MSRVFLNKEDINIFVNNLSSKAKTQNVKTWLSSNLLNFLTKKYRGVRVLNDHSVICTASCKTLAMAVKNKETIYEINLSNRLKSEVEHIIDFLESDSAPKRLTRLDYKDAKKQSVEWTNRLNKLKDELNPAFDDLTILADFSDGHKLVWLKTKEDFQFEGQNMRHCVSSYWKNGLDRNENYKILSVRDPDCKPVCTIETRLRGNEIVIEQLKGKENTGVVSRDIARDIYNYFYEKYRYVTWYDETAFGPKVDLENGKRVPLALMPDNSTIRQNLYLDDSDIQILPKGLTVEGNMSLDNCPISFIGDDLHVKGVLSITNSQVAVIDSSVKVDRYVTGAEYSLLVSYPDHIKVEPI